MLTKFSIF